MVSALGNGVKACPELVEGEANECILRVSRAVRHAHGVARRETTPMRKPPTGEPCAGELHARFGGRGGR